MTARSNVYVSTLFLTSTLLTFPVSNNNFSTHKNHNITCYFHSQISGYNSQRRNVLTQFQFLTTQHGICGQSRGTCAQWKLLKKVQVFNQTRNDCSRRIQDKEQVSLQGNSVLEKASPSVPPAHDDKHTSGFVNLKFKTKLKTRERPKRRVLWLCPIDKFLADRGSKVENFFFFFFIYLYWESS